MKIITKIQPEIVSEKRRKNCQLLNSVSAQISYYSELIQRNPEWEYVGMNF